MEQIKKKDAGFTLLETLVGMGLLAIISVIVSGALLTTIKSSNKTTSLNNVRQNGDYAIGVMERMIRSSKSVTLLSLPPFNYNDLQIINPDNGQTDFICGDINGHLLIASQSATANPLIPATTSLITYTAASPIEVFPDCNKVFTVIPGQLGSYPDTVTVNFSLQQLPGGSVAEGAQMNFQSKVSLRNY